ncbi:MAG: CU044_2847 family protein [Cyanobacteria bacterium J06598_1]
MAQLVPILLEDGTEIYVESTEDVNVSPDAESANSEPGEALNDDEETLRTGRKGVWPSRPQQSEISTKSAAATAAQSFKAIESTIRTYTNQTLNAFKDMAGGNVDKVTLQFGIRIAGEAGVPYVTKGTAESNLSITVECSFDEEN